MIYTDQHVHCQSSPDSRTPLREMAAAALCESGGAKPCRACRHCRKVFQGEFPGIHPDVALVERAADKSGKPRREILVDQIRALAVDTLVLPNEADGKVYIFPEADKMNLAAQNAFLKLLEEPPQQTVFILVSEEPEKLLETIRSRTQRFDFKRISDEAIEQALIARRGIDADTAHRIARIANGSWTAALDSLRAGNESSMFFDLFAMLMRYAYSKHVKELKKWSESVAAFGRERQKRMLIYFNRMVRESFMHNFHNPELNYMTAQEEQFCTRFAPFINERNVIELNELFEHSLRDISQNANAKMVFFDIALQTIILITRKKQA